MKLSPLSLILTSSTHNITPPRRCERTTVALSRKSFCPLPEPTKSFIGTCLAEEANTLLSSRWTRIMGSKVARREYQTLFRNSAAEVARHLDRSGNRSFPTSPPNEAYMRSLEVMWRPVNKVLKLNNLRTLISLRDSFPGTEEFSLPGGDPLYDHFRVFRGSLVEAGSQIPMFSFELNAPHSHRHFDIQEPPNIKLTAISATY